MRQRAELPLALPVFSASLLLVSRDQEAGPWFCTLKVMSDTGHCPLCS